MEKSYIGYIFTGYEILYLAKRMGAESIIGMKFDAFTDKADIMERAEESLISKNYVFRNFNGELVFNGELKAYFEPIVLWEKYAACLVETGEIGKSAGVYIKGEDYVIAEKEDVNEENYVLTRGRGLEAAAESLVRETDRFEECDGEDCLISYGFVKTKEGEAEFLSYGLYDGRIFKHSVSEGGAEEIEGKEIEAEIRNEFLKLISD